MPLGQTLVSFVLGITKSAAFKLLEQVIEGPKSDEAQKELYRAIECAGARFYEKYGDNFGSSTTSFLARKANEDCLLRAAFLSSEELQIENIIREGFEGALPASDEALRFFLEAFREEVRQVPLLDEIFETRRHHFEQREFLNEYRAGSEKLFAGQEEIRKDLSAKERRAEERHLELMEALSLRNGSHQKFELIQQVQEASGHSASAATADRTPEHDPLESALHEQIDQYRDLIKQFQAELALKFLQNFKDKKWDTVSDQIRFRVQTNIGAALLGLGRLEEAARAFLDARAFEPESEKALTNTVLARLILNQPEEALAVARRGAGLHPRSAHAHAMVVAAAAENQSNQDPFALIPEEFHSNPEVAFYFSEFFQKRNQIEKARFWIRKAYSLDPDSTQFREGLAQTLLEDALEDKGVVFGRRISAVQKAELLQARELYQGLWDEVKQTPAAGAFIYRALNLSNIQRLLGDDSAISKTIKEANRTSPDDPFVRRQMVLLALDRNDTEDALNILKSLPEDAFPDKVLMEVETLSNMGRWEEVLARLSEYSEATSDPDALPMVQTFKVQAIKNTQGADAALKEADLILADYPSNYHLLAYLVRLLNSEKRKEEAKNRLKDSKARLSKGSSYLEKMLIAEGCFDLGLYEDALPLFRQLYSNQVDNSNLRKFMACLLETDRRKEALTLYKGLPDTVRENSYFSKIGAELYRRLGQLDKSLHFMEHYLVHRPEDLYAHLVTIQLCQQLGFEQTAQKKLNDLAMNPKGSGEDLIRLAQILVQKNMIWEGYQVAYFAVRSNPPSYPLHMGYIGVFLFFQNTRGSEAEGRLQISQVAPDTAFCLTDGDNPALIIEDIPGYNPFGEPISPSHPIAQKAIGLRKGEKFLLTETPPKAVTIKWVKHKFLHALHEIMARLDLRFPGQKGLISVELQTKESGEPDFQPILDSLDSMHRFIEESNSIYQENFMPVAALATRLGRHPAQVWAGLMNKPGFRIICCTGTTEERTKALRMVAENSKGFVVDPLTLFGLYIMGIHDDVKTSASNLAMTQSGLDVFQELIHEKTHLSGSLSLGKEKEQYVKQVVSEEEKRHQILFIESIRDWAKENCEILPAVGKKDMDPIPLEFAHHMAPAILDTLLAASGSERMLLSDDLRLREFAKAFLEVKGTWSQVLLMIGAEGKQFPLERYHESITALIQSNYTFISMNSSLLEFLAKKGWRLNQDFCSVADRLGEKDVDLASSIFVAVDFLIWLWKRSIFILDKESFTHRTISGLVQNWEICETLIEKLVANFYLKAQIEGLTKPTVKNFIICIMRWHRTHFLPLPGLLKDMRGVMPTPGGHTARSVKTKQS